MADSKLNFTSVELLSFGRGPSGGHAKFKSSLTKSIMERLDWAEMPECITGGNLEGELDATQIELVPTDKALARHAVTIDTSRIAKFQTMRLELPESRGKGHRTELRFSVKFPDVRGCRKLEEYMLTCGKSTLVVRYTPRAVQADLPGVEAIEEQRQAALEIPTGEVQ